MLEGMRWRKMLRRDALRKAEAYLKDTVKPDEWHSRPADCVRSPRATSNFGFKEPPVTGASLLNDLRKGGGRVSEAFLDAVEHADKNDLPPDNPWA
jgi:hypothetical protein